MGAGPGGWCGRSPGRALIETLRASASRRPQASRRSQHGVQTLVCKTDSPAAPGPPSIPPGLLAWPQPPSRQPTSYARACVRTGRLPGRPGGRQRQVRLWAGAMDAGWALQRPAAGPAAAPACTSRPLGAWPPLPAGPPPTGAGSAMPGSWRRPGPSSRVRAAGRRLPPLTRRLPLPAAECLLPACLPLLRTSRLLWHGPLDAPAGQQTIVGARRQQRAASRGHVTTQAVQTPAVSGARSAGCWPPSWQQWPQFALVLAPG